MKVKQLCALFVSAALSLSASAVSAFTSSRTAFADDTVWKGWHNNDFDVDWHDEEQVEVHISTARELAGMVKLVESGKSMEGQTIILDNDIRLNEVGDYDDWNDRPPNNDWKAIGDMFNPFNGTFNGNGHAIIGLYQTCESNSDSNKIYFGGLFGYLDENGTIENVKLENSYIDNVSRSSGDNALFVLSAGICGWNAGIVSGCTNNGYVYAKSGSSGACAGGICAYSDGAISNCMNLANVNSSSIAESFAGGICGENYRTIKKCANKGYIDSSGNGTVVSGGICGAGEKGDMYSYYIEDCYNQGTISGGSSGNGGILGCSIASDYTYRGAIYKVYNVGNVRGGSENSNSGAILGYTDKDYVPRLNSCYFLSGNTTLHGIGNLSTNSHTSAKSRNNMQSEEIIKSLGSSFVYNSGGFPMLAWETNANTSIGGISSGEPSVWDSKAKPDESWHDEEQSEIHISTAAEFAGMVTLVASGKTMEGQTIVLDNDIILNNVSDYDTWGHRAPKNNWEPIGSVDNYFNGTFDGKGHTITGFYQNSVTKSDDGDEIIPEVYYGGLFSFLGENGTIKNLSIEQSFINNSSSSKLSNGSICGISFGEISNCSFNGQIYSNSVKSYAGGICSGNFGTVLNCINNGYVESHGSTQSVAGGICGETDRIIKNCANKGTITSYVDDGELSLSGGICGNGYKGDFYSYYIENCYNQGRINGGLLGNGGILGLASSTSGAIYKVYNTGTVREGNSDDSDSFSGAILGSYDTNCFPRLNACYYLSGATTLKGIGINSSDDTTSAKSKNNMQSEDIIKQLGSAFIYNSNEYPLLAWEKKTADIINTTTPKLNYTDENLLIEKTLTIKVLDYSGNITWKSSDESVAVINENGVVTAIAEGNAQISAMLDDGTTLTCNIRVEASGLRGDANNDGKVNIRDAAAIARAAALKKLGELPAYADYNDDNTVNIRDAAAIARDLARGLI